MSNFSAIKEHLFKQLDRVSALDLSKPENQVQLEAEVKRGKSLHETARILVDMAKVEIDVISELGMKLDNGILSDAKYLGKQLNTPKP